MNNRSKLLGALLVVAAAASTTYFFELREEPLICVTDFCQIAKPDELVIPLGLRFNVVRQLAHGVEGKQVERGIYVRAHTARAQAIAGFGMCLYLISLLIINCKFASE
jgi:hypothetical protein